MISFGTNDFGYTCKFLLQFNKSNNLQHKHLEIINLFVKYVY